MAPLTPDLPATPRRAVASVPVAELTALQPAAERPATDLSALDGAAAIALVFRDFAGLDCGRGPPAGWTVGVMPTAALPIDREVERLRAEMRADLPRLQRDALSDFGEPCPFYAARMAVVAAARAGRHETTLRDAGEAAGDLGREAAALSRQLHDFLSRLPVDLDAATTPLDRRPDPITGHAARAASAERRAAVEAAAVALNREAAALAQGRDRTVRAGPRGNPWKVGFARSLGFVWFLLAGREPSAAEDSRFRDFVSAGYQTLGGPVADAWRGSIETARSRVADWERWAGWDWMVAAVLPPEVTALRRYPTMDAARHGADKMAAAHARLCPPDQRPAMEAHGRDLVDLAVATAGDATASFEDVLAVARRVAVFRRATMAAARNAALAAVTGQSGHGNSPPAEG